MGAGVGALEGARKDLAELPVDARVQKLVERGIDAKDAQIIASQFDNARVLAKELKDPSAVLDAADALREAGLVDTVQDKLSKMSTNVTPKKVKNSFHENINMNAHRESSNMQTPDLKRGESTPMAKHNYHDMKQMMEHHGENTLNESVYSMASVDFTPNGMNHNQNPYSSPSSNFDRPRTARDDMLERKKRQQAEKDRAYQETVVQSRELLASRASSRAVRDQSKQRDNSSQFGRGAGVHFDPNSTGAGGGTCNGGGYDATSTIKAGSHQFKQQWDGANSNNNGSYYSNTQGGAYHVSPQAYAGQQIIASNHGNGLTTLQQQQPWNISVDKQQYAQQQQQYPQPMNPHNNQLQNTQDLINKRGEGERQASSGSHSGSGFQITGGVESVDDGAGMKTVSKKGLMAKGKWRMAEKRELGSGSFGQVYLGLDIEKGSLLAVKKLSISTSQLDDEDGAHLKELEQEVDLMRSLHHVNVVRYLGAELHVDANLNVLYVLQEWVAGGSLGGLVRAFGPLEQEVCKCYALCIIKGLEFLHAQSIVHRDLKPDNILITDQGIAKIADFGASKRLSSATLGTMGEKEWSLKGTPFYMSPEQMKQEECGRKSDIWALGGCCLFMATSDFPWRFASGFEKAGKMNSFAFFFKVMDSPDATPLTGIPDEKLRMINQPNSEPMFPFLARCFERESANRASAVELLSHPWLRKKELL